MGTVSLGRVKIAAVVACVVLSLSLNTAAASSPAATLSKTGHASVTHLRLSASKHPSTARQVNFRRAARQPATVAKPRPAVHGLLTAPGKRLKTQAETMALKRSARSHPTVTRTPALPIRQPLPVAPDTASPGFEGMNDQVNDTTYGCSPASWCLEPPDPFVAAGPNVIVQTVNTSLRITNRSGSGATTLSFYDFFGIPGSEAISDPRVLYDTGHGRWLASIASWNCDTGYLWLGVSQTGDPSGAWTTWDLAYPGSLPDYPQLGMSADKVAFSYNAYDLSGCSVGGYQGTATTVMDWSSLLAGGSLPWVYTTPSTYYWDWRQATGRDSSADMHGVVSEAGTSGYAFDYTLTSGSVVDYVNNGSDPLHIGIYYLYGAFVEGLDIVPPADEAGSLGVDSRVTDAVAQDGELTFVSTYPCGESEVYDCVRVSQLDVGTLSARQDFLVAGPSFYDAFMGGIGMSADGHLYVVWSQASVSTAIDTLEVDQSISAPVDTVGPSSLVMAGGGPYGLSRWGDYVGVAPDPNDASAVWQADEFPTSNNDWSTWVSALHPSSIAPGNDSFGGAAAVSSLPFHDSVDTLGASLETGEPQPACASVGNTVWYRVVLGKSSRVRVDTVGSDFDTVLGAYQGTSLGSLGRVACNDDRPSDTQSQLSFFARAGHAYYIQAGGYHGASGQLNVNIIAESNDAFAAAFKVSPVPYTAYLNTVTASRQLHEPEPACANMSKTVWFRITPNWSGQLTARTTGSGFDTVIAAYKGTVMTALRRVACNDDVPSASTSKVSFRVVAGNTYYFQVGGYAGQSGELVFYVKPTP